MLVLGELDLANAKALGCQRRVSRTKLEQAGRGKEAGSRGAGFRDSKNSDGQGVAIAPGRQDPAPAHC